MKKFFGVIAVIIPLFMLIGCEQKKTQPSSTSTITITTVTVTGSVSSPTPVPSIESPVPTSTPLPLPDTSDLCILYQYQDTLWFKEGEAPPRELAMEEPDLIVPPVDPLLLPEVEVYSVEEEADITTRLLPYRGIRHPSGQAIWFNTELPLDYGKYVNSDLWQLDVGDGTIQQLLPDGLGGQFFYFSPDGQYLVMATDHDIKLMDVDGNDLHVVFEFPEFQTCTEANGWVQPTWISDSSGLVVDIPAPDRCKSGNWSTSSWILPIDGEPILIDESPVPRKEIDENRYVYWRDGMLYLEQTGFAPRPLVPLASPGEGYAVFPCSKIR